MPRRLSWNPTPPRRRRRASPGSCGSPSAPSNPRAFVEEEKRFALEVADKLELEFNVVETDYFIFYTNLSEREAYEWQRVLDLMYERVSYLLDTPKGVNVFRGKALVFLFETKEQFGRFESKIYNHGAGWAAGYCHQHPTGQVRISFYRLDDKQYLKQLMIHEAAHGVVFRYRSGVDIPNWLDEGIAEWTASTVILNPRPFKYKKRTSAEAVKKRGHLPLSFFGDDNWKKDQYGTALAMVEILLRRGRPRFVEFFNNIKDGQDWQDSLLQQYDLTIDDLVGLYGREISMKDLKTR